MKRSLAYAVFAGLMAAAIPASAQEKLEVWWVKGFYKAEDDALSAALLRGLLRHVLLHDLLYDRAGQPAPLPVL